MWSGIVTDAIAMSGGFLQNFQAVIILVVGVMVFGLVVSIVMQRGK